MESADKYNLWIFNKFAKYIKGKVLEIGCGIGTITQFYADRFDITASDISQGYREIVGRRFSGCQNFHTAIIDIESKINASHEHNYDTIISSNVLEHIENDNAALLNMYNILKEDGTLVLLVPACHVLFSSLDKNVGHYRRYSKAELRKKLEAAGFSVQEQFHVNIFGAIGWFFSGRILKKRTLNSGSLSVFNVLVPLFIFIENTIKIPFGLSIINICKKTK